MSILFALVTVLGAMLAHWSHAGIEDGDHEKRAWARVVGPVLAILAGLGALVSLMIGNQ